MARLVHYSDVENAFDDPAGAARLAGLIRELDGADALVVGTGDNTAPGVVSLVTRGGAAIEFYAATDTALETFGNHDFDYGPDRTRELVSDSPVEWVSANVRDGNGEPFGRGEGVVPWTVRRVGGRRVGFVGLTDPATDSLNPMAADLTFDDPLPAAREAVAALADRGVDRTVVLSHLGAGDDELAATLEVDAVLGGHVHTRRVERVDGTLLVRPGVNGGAVAEVSLAGDPTARLHESAGAPLHEPLRGALSGLAAEAGLDEPVGRVDEPIARDGETVHGGECRVGNFVADAYRWATGADVGLSNSGGIRPGEPLSGTVTRADAISLVPFEEPVVVASVTGRELRSILAEMAGAELDFGEDGWWHGHVSNARVVYDTAAGGLREALVDGEPIDPDRRYAVATAEYLLHSDHEFPTLAERHRSREGPIQHEALAAYARETGIDPETEGRVRIVRGEPS